MKIAIVISEFPSLNETFVLDHITGLIDRGHDVHVYATAPPALAKVHDEVRRYHLNRCTVYRNSGRFTVPGNKVHRVVRGTRLLAEGLFQNPRAALTSINVFGFGRAACSLSLLYRVAPFLGSPAYDVVHCHFSENGQLAVSLRDVGALRGKIVTSFHGYQQAYVGSGRMGRFDDLFRKGDLFLTCSEHMKQWFERGGWGAGKIVVHRNGVKLDRFQPANPRSGDGPVRVLSVGRLVEKKGFQYGITGVAKVLRRFPDLQYDIVGDGPERTSLEGLIRELGVGERIRLVGWQERAEVVRLLGRATVLLAPSVTAPSGDREGIPVVLHEAMALGLPVISTQHTGIPEVVQDGESGFLVAERDVEAIAERLTHLVKQPEVGWAMGRKGRRHAEEFSNLDKQTDRLVEIYRALTDPRAGNADVLGSLRAGDASARAYG